MNQNAAGRTSDVFNSDRVKNLEGVLEKGINPYPYSFRDAVPLGEVVARYEELEGKTVRTTGRLTSRREMGRTTFLDLSDGNVSFQLYVRQDRVGKPLFKIINKCLDLGDFVGVEGELFTTKMGERSLNVGEFTVLAKSLILIPYGKKTEEKTYYALADLETKRQDRVLD